MIRPLPLSYRCLRLADARRASVESPRNPVRSGQLLAARWRSPSTVALTPTASGRTSLRLVLAGASLPSLESCNLLGANCYESAIRLGRIAVTLGVRLRGIGFAWGESLPRHGYSLGNSLGANC